ncbi:cupin domain-containing protein [Streptomyces mirabilis]|nr:cupin domain-containing protein [Streptomyces mirabilis]
MAAPRPAPRRRRRSPGRGAGGPRLGPALESGERPQVLVPGHVWQSARPTGDREVLVSCVVAPGFDYADFRLLDNGP